MNARTLVAVAGLVAMLGLTVQAHHSFTSFYDMAKTVTVTGTVKQVKLVNPHPEMLLEVVEGGQRVEWRVTGRATGTGILRAGWNKETVPVGLEVTVEGNPSRQDGTRMIAAGKITKADGSVVWFGGGGGIAAGI